MPRRAQALETLLDTVHRLSGADFRRYRRASLMRRVVWRMEQEGLDSIEALCSRVIADPQCLARVTAALTLHVTTMFRDPPLFRLLRRELDMLRTFVRPRLWVAACSTGQELYSLLILLHEEGVLSQCTVYATDLSAAAVAQARTGCIAGSAWSDYDAAYRAAGGRAALADYFEPAGDDELRLRSPLMDNVVFDVHDLLRGASFNEFQLVMCRNVLMYLDEAGQARVHSLLHQSLSPLGVLCLGMGESLLHSPHRADYALLDPAEPIYRRLR